MSFSQISSFAVLLPLIFSVADAAARSTTGQSVSCRFMCSQFFFWGGHNIHYDINLEGTLRVKKNLISKKKKFGKGGA